MRALLVVNHKATTTSGRVRDVLVQALHCQVDLRVVHTERRGHAAALAEQAAADGLDVVVALGGDGTVNEVVNGLLTHGVRPDGPALAVVPGGSTNVFARALGLPAEWVEATGVLLEALRANRFRSIGLGRADDRYFTFCAGLGLDAEVISRVERARYRGDTPSPWLYARTLARHYAVRIDRRNRPITLERPGEDPVPDLASVVVQNTNPSTYLGRRRVDVCPRASFDSGLDVAALRGLRVPATVRFFTELLIGRSRAGQPVGPTGSNVLHVHDVTEFTLVAKEPIGFQLDGDYLGPREKVRFTAVPHALRVIC
jgi:Sphingosine kinase and enzymes related to eukaryotic diacylglycerol kinase